MTVFHPSANIFSLTNRSYFYLFVSQDLSSPNQYDTGVALTGLSCFVTPDLARDLANDIMTLVSHGKEFYQQGKLCCFFPDTISQLKFSCIFIDLRYSLSGV